MIYQRATKQLRAAGIVDLVIVKRLFGAAPENPAWPRQKSRCFRTPDAAVQAVLAGWRPTLIFEDQGKEE